MHDENDATKTHSIVTGLKQNQLEIESLFGVVGTNLILF
jgi:hypothetical protein